MQRNRFWVANSVQKSKWREQDYHVTWFLLHLLILSHICACYYKACHRSVEAFSLGWKKSKIKSAETQSQEGKIRTIRRLNRDETNGEIDRQCSRWSRGRNRSARPRLTRERVRGCIKRLKNLELGGSDEGIIEYFSNSFEKNYLFCVIVVFTKQRSVSIGVDRQSTPAWFD